MNSKMGGASGMSDSMMDFDSPMSSPAGNYEDEEKEFLKIILDVDDVLENFEHRVLRGEIKRVNMKTGEPFWEKLAGSAPPVNEIGVREIMGRLLGKVSKAAKLTYMEDEECYKSLFYFDMSITEFFAKRCDRWEMDLETMKAIKDACIEMVQDIVFSSRSGFTAINLKSQYSRSDVTRSEGTSSESKGRSFLGIPLPGRRK